MKYNLLIEHGVRDLRIDHDVRKRNTADKPWWQVGQHMTCHRGLLIYGSFHGKPVLNSSRQNGLCKCFGGWPMILGNFWEISAGNVQDMIVNSSESEGKSYARSAFAYFKDHGKAVMFIPFAATCAFRLAGYKLGKNYKKLSRRQILRCTASPTFFYKYWS